MTYYLQYTSCTVYRTISLNRSYHTIGQSLPTLNTDPQTNIWLAVWSFDKNTCEKIMLYNSKKYMYCNKNTCFFHFKNPPKIHVKFSKYKNTRCRTHKKYMYCEEKYMFFELELDVESKKKTLGDSQERIQTRYQ